jgi:Tfp pilus assembly protein PilN
MWIAALVVGALILVVLVTCGSLYRRLHSNRERIVELQGEIAKETQRAEEIEEYKQC